MKTRYYLASIQETGDGTDFSLEDGPFEDMVAVEKYLKGEDSPGDIEDLLVVEVKAIAKPKISFCLERLK